MLSESDILFAIYIAIPAYVANAFPTLFKGGPPIDLGRRFMDGERILGDNKTLRGLAFGLLSGLSATVAEALFFGQELLLLGGLVSVGALSGDLLGAFIKRRMKFQPGAPFPLLDQLDFVLGALLLSYPVHHVSLGTVLVIVISTPPIHLLANSIAYRLGVKKNWW
ncbi:MAG: CDP-2,3-bis-(O-geranylgeranyl)-sn-glycerol synthase [Candidatus Bathyarchaeia archaeon]